MKELDTVVLSRAIPEHDLREGDVGAIVFVHGESQAYEVEFVTADGRTQALLTLPPEDIRPMSSKEILHVRDLGREAA